MRDKESTKSNLVILSLVFVCYLGDQSSMDLIHPRTMDLTPVPIPQIMDLTFVPLKDQRKDQPGRMTCSSPPLAGETGMAEFGRYCLVMLM